MGQHTAHTNGSVDNANTNNYYDRQLFIKRIMKLTNKQKTILKWTLVLIWTIIMYKLNTITNG